jgi:uracil phosphoribosyltransferase
MVSIIYQLTERKSLHISSLNYIMKNVHVLKYTPQLEALYTIIRNKDTSREDFIFYSDRIISILLEEGFNFLPFKPVTVTTSLDVNFRGSKLGAKVCAVSILRSGESMEWSLRSMYKDMRIGKILLQRDEKTHEAKFYFAKLPPDVSKRHVLLLDPMLGTAGSAISAVEVLKKHKVKEDHIIFINLISYPPGIEKLHNKFPEMKIVTGFMDNKMTKNKYLLPGLGDFGDRYFGTY